MKITNVCSFKTTDHGRYGKALEMAITGLDYVQPAGKVDYRHGKCFDIKSGGSELGEDLNHLLKGSTMVIYVPVIVEGADGSIDPMKQEGFVLTREHFLEAINRVGLLRSKTRSNGTPCYSIQTFWNRTKWEPNGKKYEPFLDALYNLCDMTLEEFLG